jgi:transposase-like protein
MHKSRQLKIRRARNEFPDWMAYERYPGKTAVMGMLDRDQRKVRATVVPNVKRETLQAEILAHVEHGSSVFTDKAVAYDKLAEKYVHDVVNHLEGYVVGKVHTNGLENFWSLLKRGLNGTYVSVEPFHLFRYVDEQVFRYNNRGSKKEKVSDFDRFSMLSSSVINKRLTFAELTGKTSPTPV